MRVRRADAAAPERAIRVPLADLVAHDAPIAHEILGRIASVARRANFVLGAEVERFERWLATRCGTAHAIGVGSGTDAVELSLRALDVGPGDAVVTPAFSFVAAAEAIVAAGAHPLFCDVDERTLNASVATVREALDRGRAAGWRVRALVPVHLFGRCADAALVRFARAEGLTVIEDAAQALGARDGEGTPAGASGDAGCFSFFPTKTLGAWGDGGAVVTSRSEVAARLRRLRAHGALAPYVHAESGRNSRLDAVQAAVLLAKTRGFDAWNTARAAAAARYRAALVSLPIIVPADAEAPAVHAWHAFVVRTNVRDALARHLREEGIETRVYYPVPLHRQPCFASLETPALPVAEDACRTALALPLFATLSNEQQELVVGAIRNFFEA